MTARSGSLALVALATAGVTVLGTGTAYAFWSATAGRTAVVQTDALGTSSAPAVSATGSRLDTTVTAGTTAGGRTPAVQVKRYATAAVGGTPLSTSSCTGTTTVTCTETGVGDGEWFASAQRKAGTSWLGQESSRTRVLVDTLAPALTVSPGSAWSNAASVTSTFSASDANTAANGGATAGVASVSWSGAATGTATSTPPVTTFAGTGPTIAAEGTSTLEYAATDAHGNRRVLTQTVRIDRTAPAVTVNETSPASSGPAAVTFTGGLGTAAETATGSADNAAVSVVVSGSSGVVSSGSASVTGGSWSYSPSGLVAGQTYTVAATQTDVAGNSRTATRSYAVASAFTVTSPAEGATGVSRTGPFAGTSGSTASVTLTFYLGSTATGTPHRTWTATPVNGSWSATNSNSGSNQQSDLTANQRYTVVITQDGSPTVTRTFTTGS